MTESLAGMDGVDGVHFVEGRAFGPRTPGESRDMIAALEVAAMGPGKRAIVYSRVSTDAQKRDGTSLDTQERACIERAQAQGFQVAATIRDSASGSNLERLGMDRLRRMVRGGEADVVITYAVDRLSRNMNQIGVLFDEAQRHGVRIETVTEPFEDSAIGTFIVQARALTAAVEREKIAERTMRGKAERARGGRLPQGTGRGTYGYHLVPGTGRRTPNEEQAPFVVRIFEAFVEGMSTLGIANMLNDENVPTFTGKKWAPATLHHLLRNESYAGRAVYRRTKARTVIDPHSGEKHRKVELRPEADWIAVDGSTPALVSETLFNAAKSLLDDPERRKRGRPKRRYALSGRVRCRRCGAASTGQTMVRGNYEYRYYRCRRSFAGSRADRCDARHVRADVLERLVREEAAKVLVHPQVVLAEAERLRAERSVFINVDDLRRQLETLGQREQRLVEAWVDGRILKPAFESKQDDIRRRRGVVERELAPAALSAPLPDEKNVNEVCAALRHWVSEAEGDSFELLLSALQIRVIAEPGFAELHGVIPLDPGAIAGRGSCRDGLAFTLDLGLGGT